MHQKVSQIYTNCKNCVFAKYANNTQIGCKLNLIDAYKKLGVEVIEAYDEEKEFYIINKKRCRSARSHHWGETKKNLAKAVCEENAIKYCAIIVPDSKSTIEDYQTTVNSLLRQTLKPKKIVNAIKNWKQETRQDYNLIFKNQEVSGVKWRNEFFLDNYSNDKCIDYISKNINNTAEFFFVVYAGSEIDDIRRFERLSYKVNIEFLEFLLISGDNIRRGYMIPKSAFIMFGGNKGKNITAKIQEVLEEEKCQDLMKSWKDLER